MPKSRTDARERILRVADDLFCREGVRAIGVDTIIAESEVAKTTFYRYFPSSASHFCDEHKCLSLNF